MRALVTAYFRVELKKRQGWRSSRIYCNLDDVLASVLIRHFSEQEVNDVKCKFYIIMSRSKIVTFKEEKEKRLDRSTGIFSWIEMNNLRYCANVSKATICNDDVTSHWCSSLVKPASDLGPPDIRNFFKAQLVSFTTTPFFRNLRI